MLKSLATLSATVCIKAFAAIAVFILAAALWDASTFGSFMYSFAISSILVIACEYGFTNQLLKDTQNKGVEFVVRLFNAKLILALLVAAIAHIAHEAFSVLGNDYFLPIFYSLLFASFFDFFSTTLRAYQKVGIDFHLSTWTAVLYAVVSVALLLAGKDATWLAWGFFFARALASMVAVLVLFNVLDGFSLRLKREEFSEIWRTIAGGFYYASDTAINSVINVVDGILVAHFAGNYANGVYQAAARLNQSIPIVFSVLTSFFLPRLASKKDKSTFKNNAKKFLSMIAVAWGAIVLFFGAAYVAYKQSPVDSAIHMAAPLLLGLVGIALIRFLCGWMSTLLIACNMQRYKTAAYGVALVVIVGSSALSIPVMGMWGIIISYALGFAACLLVMCPAALKIYTQKEAI